jgi:hypothetical protein
MNSVDPLAPAEARRRFTEDYDKTVKPLLGLAMDYSRLSVEYGKVTLQYLFLFNGGGLTGLVALYPTVKSSAWVAESIWSAGFFGCGLFFVSAAAGISFVTQQQAALYCYQHASDEEAWVADHCSRDPQRETIASEPRRRRRFEPGINRATKYAVAFAIVSAASAIAGGIWLAVSLARTIP